nr:FAD-dependent oxidoreductase [Mariniblastus fucicola]
MPACVSASQIAFGSIRMEPVSMVLGQPSAIAGSMAIDRVIAVRDLDQGQLKNALLAEGQVLKRPPRKRAKPRK